MVAFGDDPGTSLEFTPLAAQYAWTVEAGTRGEQFGLSWQLALYRSWLRNELLEVNNAQGVELGAVNVPRSYHQGIEAGLEFDLLHLGLAEAGREKGEQHLNLEQTYTLNDFHFDNDPVYGKNRIAGIPVHLYEAAVIYEHPCGFYAGPTFRWNITKYPVDQANTLFADPYFLFGFRAGFRFKNKMTVFVEARNLTDERYPSALEAIPDARTATQPIEIFQPGDGRSFYGGVSWTL
jgi:iron complex outermembrane receptor protein